MSKHSRFVWVILSSALSLLVSGCSSDGLIKPKGKILKDGEPVNAQEYGAVDLIFTTDVVPTDESMATYPANVSDDGSFVVLGPERKGIPPGKYKMKLDLKAKKKAKNTKSASMTTTQEVTGSEEIILDLGQAQTGK